MAISILAYSIFTGACYFAAQPWQLAVLRFAAALGMGGEWALGVALVVECWPDRFRPLLAGVIGAAGNLGYLVIALVVAIGRGDARPWRWTMLALHGAGTAGVCRACISSRIAAMAALGARVGRHDRSAKSSPPV